MIKGRKLVYHEGERIHNLTAVKDLLKRDHRNRNVWKFRCDCGAEIEAAASDVSQGRKWSCKACSKEAHRKWLINYSRSRTKPEFDGPLTKRFGDYRRAAERRGYKWELSKDQFKSLIKQNCHYCGCAPKTEFSLAKVKTPENILVYNGVDRKDNLLGYTVDNCIPACVTCNRMKMSLPYQEFVDKIKEIGINLRHNEIKGDIRI